MTNFTGTSSNDTLNGGANNDLIEALGGADSVRGGKGQDSILGGEGNDILWGDKNDSSSLGDTIYGDSGNDLIWGDVQWNADGAGADILHGGEGNDTIYGGAGNDSIRGGKDDDHLYGDNGQDSVYGDLGNDVIHGGKVEDSLYGGADNDTIYGDAGQDYIEGGDGDDWLYGGLEGENTGESVNVDLNADIIDGGHGDDVIYGNAGDDTVIGGFGNDTIYGNGGHDSINAQDGNDSIRGGKDNDTVFGGNGNDTLYGDGGNDQFWGGNGADVAIFEGHVDRFNFDNVETGSDGKVYTTISDNSSNPDDIDQGTNVLVDVEVIEFHYQDSLGGDVIDKFEFIDGEWGRREGGEIINGTLAGTPGADSLEGSINDDKITGGGGNDTINGGFGNDFIQGNAQDDVLIGGLGDDTIRGGKDDDSILGNQGGDILYGDKGNDILYGGKNGDTLYGGEDNDTLYGDLGNDSLDGGVGVDEMTGGGGNDIFVIRPDANTNDLIHDFNQDVTNELQEKIDIRRVSNAQNFETFKGDHLSQNGNDTVISLPNQQTITLSNVTLSTLDATDFIGAWSDTKTIHIFKPGNLFEHVPGDEGANSQWLIDDVHEYVINGFVTGNTGNTDLYKPFNIIDLTEFGFASSTDIMSYAAQVGSDVVLTFTPTVDGETYNQTVTIQGITLSDITADNFLLEPGADANQPYNEIFDELRADWWETDLQDTIRDEITDTLVQQSSDSTQLTYQTNAHSVTFVNQSYQNSAIVIEEYIVPADIPEDSMFVIEDYTSGRLINLSNLGVTNFTEIGLTEDEYGNAVVNAGEGRFIRIDGVSLNEIEPQDFSFSTVKGVFEDDFPFDDFAELYLVELEGLENYSVLDFDAENANHYIYLGDYEVKDLIVEEGISTITVNNGQADKTVTVEGQVTSDKLVVNDENGVVTSDSRPIPSYKDIIFNFTGNNEVLPLEEINYGITTVYSTSDVIKLSTEGQVQSDGSIPTASSLGEDFKQATDRIKSGIDLLGGEGVKQNKVIIGAKKAESVVSVAKAIEGDIEFGIPAETVLYGMKVSGWFKTFTNGVWDTKYVAMNGNGEVSLPTIENYTASDEFRVMLENASNGFSGDSYRAIFTNEVIVDFSGVNKYLKHKETLKVDQHSEIIATLGEDGVVNVTIDIGWAGSLIDGLELHSQTPEYELFLSEISNFYSKKLKEISLNLSEHVNEINNGGTTLPKVHVQFGVLLDGFDVSDQLNLPSFLPSNTEATEITSMIENIRKTRMLTEGDIEFGEFNTGVSWLDEDYLANKTRTLEANIQGMQNALDVGNSEYAFGDIIGESVEGKYQFWYVGPDKKLFKIDRVNDVGLDEIYNRDEFLSLGEFDEITLWEPGQNPFEETLSELTLEKTETPVEERAREIIESPDFQDQIIKYLDGFKDQVLDKFGFDENGKFVLYDAEAHAAFDADNLGSVYGDIAADLILGEGVDEALTNVGESLTRSGIQGAIGQGFTLLGSTNSVLNSDLAAGVYAVFSGQIDGVGDAAIQLANGVISSAINAFVRVGLTAIGVPNIPILTDVIANVVTSLIMNSIGDELEELFDAVGDIVDGLGDLVGDPVNTIGDWIDDLDNAIFQPNNWSRFEDGNGNDVRVTDSEYPLVYLNGGDDVLIGSDGWNIAFGGAGNDILIGGDGSLGNHDKEQLFGQEGDDVINGKENDDDLMGGGGADYIEGNEGDDLIYGGDNLSAAWYDDEIDTKRESWRDTGEDGNDTIKGGKDDDAIYAQDGDDIIQGDKGLDIIWTGTGNDIIKIKDGDLDVATEVDIINDFAVASDVLDLSGITGIASSVITTEIVSNYDIWQTYNLEETNPVGDPVFRTHRLNIKAEGTLVKVDGVAVAFLVDVVNALDTITILDGTESTGSTALYSGATNGADTINGTAGDDTIAVGDGADIVDGGAGNDLILGQGGDDDLYGKDGNDTIIGAEGRDLIHGGLGDDSITGNGGLDTIYGNGGDDTMLGGKDNDTLEGGDGADKIHGNYGDDFILGNADADELIGNEGHDTIKGGQGDDTLQGSAGNDILQGDAGNDNLDGGADVKDRAVFSGNRANYVVTVIAGGLTTVQDTVGSDGTDTLTSIEFIDFADESLHFTNSNTWVTANNNFARGEAIAADINGDTLAAADGFDTITGSSNNDVLLGLRGNDSISGQAGNDVLQGNEGDDTLEGGDGTDFITGEDGNDSILGDGGSDTLTGGEGHDTVRGGEGDDQLTGNAGDDLVTGDEGDDSVDGGSGRDTVDGGAGNDLILGGKGDDTLIVGTGNDTVDGEDGTDVVIFTGNSTDYSFTEHTITHTASGDVNTVDNVELLRFDDRDLLWNGSIWAEENIAPTVDNAIADISVQIDTALSYTLASDVFSDVNAEDNLLWIVTLEDGSPLPSWLTYNSNTRELSGTPDINQIGTLSVEVTAIDPYGAQVSDVFTLSVTAPNTQLGTSGADTLNGTSGIDSISGLAGDDVITGGGDHDYLEGNEDNDSIKGGDFDDTLLGQAGNDTLKGDSGNDYLEGGIGDDELYGGTDDDVLRGGEGNDTLDGNDGRDYLYGEAGNDSLRGSADEDVMDGGADDDTVNGVAGDDRLYGGLGNDLVLGGADSDVLYGEEGIDTLDGEGGDDYLYGGEGTDSLSGGTGQDYLAGGTENDTLEGNEDNDFLTGYNGDDVLSGGDDNDTLQGGVGNDSLDGGLGDDVALFSDRIEDYTLSYDSVSGTTTVMHIDTVVYDEGIDSLTGIETLQFSNGGLEFNGTDWVAYNTDPIVDEGITAQTANENTNFSFTVPLSAFEDADNWDDLTYTATLADGSALPSWLSFAGRTFSGIPLGTDATNLSIRVVASDGNGGVDAETTFMLTVNADYQETITGTNLAESIVGDSVGGVNEHIYALEGDDTVNGDEGNDHLEGGDGNDSLNGGLGTDSLEGGSGDDTLIGDNDTITSNDNDILDGGEGYDIAIYSGNYDQYTVAVSGAFTSVQLNDTVDSPDSDQLSNIETLVFAQGTPNTKSFRLYDGQWYEIVSSATTGNDYLEGGAIDDTITGGEGNDVLLGRAGNDSLSGDNGDDALEGNAGNDTLIGNAGNDVITGGTGQDSIDGGAGSDTIDSGDDADSIDAGIGDDYIISGNGNDTIVAADGNDTVYAGDGHDSVNFYGSDGDNLVYGDLGDDTIVGSENGNDELHGNEGSDYLIGEAGNDTLYGGSGDDEHLGGGAGEDVIYGGAGDDSINAGVGNDIAYAESGDDSIQGGTGSDTIYAGTGNDTIIGEDGHDLIFGEDGHDVIADTNSSYSDDTVYGGDGNDTITTSSGNDVIDGGNDDDSITVSGTGNSSVSGGDGDDTISVRSGADSLSGGEGNDVFLYTSTSDSSASDQDIIEDFVQGEDIIDLRQINVSDISDLTITQDTVSGTTSIAQTNSSFVIELLGIYTLSNADFGFGGVIDGTNVAETLIGTHLHETFNGRAGDDLINAGSGDDWLDGEGGDDTLIGGDGNDTIEGGTGTNRVIYRDTYADYTLTVDNATNAITIEHTSPSLFDDGVDVVMANPNYLQFADLTMYFNGSSWVYDNSFVVLKEYIFDQIVDVDSVFSYGISSYFADADNDAITFIATLSDDSALPTWLSFNQTTGVFSGTPDADDEGVIEVVVTAGDGSGYTVSDTFLIDVDLKNMTINGTSNADILTGGAYLDFITGGGGDDEIFGLEESDTLKGDGGDDTIEGGAGDDYIEGGAGVDSLSGNMGNDTIESGGGINETLDGGMGDDSLKGGDNAQILLGGEGNDTLKGLEGADYLEGGAGDDSIRGGAHNDTIIGGEGADSLYGEDQIDMLSYVESGAAVTVNIATNTASGGHAQGDVIAGFDGITGSDYDDSLTGNSGANDLVGGLGDDTLNGSAGDDRALYTGNRADYTVTATTITDNNSSDGDEGTDTLNNIETLVFADSTLEWNGTEWIDPDTVGQNISGDISNESLVGGNGDDTITGNAGDDTLEGLAGDDSLTGNQGVDHLYGGAGNDTLDSGGAAGETLDGGAGDDSLKGGDHGQFLLGGDGNDTLKGLEGTDYLEGGAGDDSIRGGAHNDTILGGEGADSLYGEDQIDMLSYVESGAAVTVNIATNSASGGHAQGDVIAGFDGITGSDYDDSLTGNSGANDLVGGLGSDTLIGGSGADSFIFASISESTSTSSDLITDFTQGADIIDLSGLGFTAIQSGSASGTTLGYTSDGSTTTITDGTSFTLTLQGDITLSNTDFTWS